MHCFTSGRALAETALALGFYLSISGIATFRSAADLRAIFAAAPRDRLLVETDSPYLAPIPHRGKRNEPAFTADTVRAMAPHLGMDPAELAAPDRANFDRLFAKAAGVTAGPASAMPAAPGRQGAGRVGGAPARLPEDGATPGGPA